jgi:hypothetical protein
MALRFDWWMDEEEVDAIHVTLRTCVTSHVRDPARRATRGPPTCHVGRVESAVVITDTKRIET